jgi:hypothetical protein
VASAKHLRISGVFLLLRRGSYEDVRAIHLSRIGGGVRGLLVVFCANRGGCQAYLSKPISVPKFIETIRRFLGVGQSMPAVNRSRQMERRRRPPKVNIAVS